MRTTRRYVVREHARTYVIGGPGSAAPAAPRGGGHGDHRASDDPPFGLPILDEVPELACLLRDLRQVDRLIARCLAAIRRLEETGLAEAATGVGLEQWLSSVARRTGADVRMLRTAAAVTRRLPSLADGFRDGVVSWAQVRSVALMVHRLPGHLDERIDAAVAQGIDGAAGSEPDAVTRIIRWSLAALEEPRTAADEDAATRAEYLAMQPRLDGTGGRFWGEAGPTTFAMLDAALNAGAQPPADGDGAASTRRVRGAARLQRLAQLLEASRTRPDEAPDDVPAARRCQLLLRTDLDTLLDRARTPAALLTTLLGGHVRVSSATARRLVQERGADLRTVVLDDTGAVVGVGRRRRLAPGWLREALFAVHDVCSAPGCEVAARACDTDHARPWYHVDPRAPGGATDVDQLAPLCGRHNRAKERDGWRVEQSTDGARQWTHPRTGLTTRTLPAAWRPPP